MKLIGIMLFIILLSSCSSTGDKTDKGSETVKTEEKTDKAEESGKSAEEYFQEFKLVLQDESRYNILKKTSKYLQLSSEGIQSEFYVWKSKGDTVLLGWHKYKPKYDPLPEFYIYDGKTAKKLTNEESVSNYREMNRYISYTYPLQMKKKGHKNCCLVYGFLPKDKNGVIELVAENLDAPESLTERSASKERVGTLEFQDGKLIFIRQ